MNQTLLGGSSAMLQHSGLSKGFWGEALGTAAYIINHAPCRHLGWRTPYEILFRRVPDVSHVCIFGCCAWVLKDEGKKWDPKSLLMILVGYEPGSKAFCLRNPASRSIVVSANVRFNESVLPNKPITTISVPTQPVASSSRLPPPTPQEYVQICWFDDNEPTYPTPTQTLPPPQYQLPTPATSAAPSTPGPSTGPSVPNPVTQPTTI